MCMDRICACMVPYAPFHSDLICNMTSFRKKMFCPLTPPKGSRVYVRTEYVCACCCICGSILFDLQHDHVLKKLNFDPNPRNGGGVGMARVLRVINLLCNMTIF